MPKHILLDRFGVTLFKKPLRGFARTEAGDVHPAIQIGIRHLESFGHVLCWDFDLDGSLNRTQFSDFELHGLFLELLCNGARGGI